MTIAPLRFAAVALAAVLVTASPPAAIEARAEWELFAQQSSVSSKVAAELYEEAQDALDDEDFETAAALFGEVATGYPKSKYAADAYYWQAFALVRVGDTSDLRKARRALVEQKEKFPKASTREDAEALLYRIDGALAKKGDAEASKRLAEKASRMQGRVDELDAERRALAAEAEADADAEDDEDMEVQMAALQALIQMDSDRALPILKKVLSRRDRKSAELREQAVFLVAQKQTKESQAILIDLLKNDPDPEVRGQAVFWLASIPGEESLDAILEVIRSTPVEDLQDNAVFALTRHQSPRAREALKSLALDPKASDHVREQAVFWIGQSSDGDAGSIAFLKEIYAKSNDEELKNQVIFGIARQNDPASKSWLLDIVKRRTEPIEARKQALFWLGQNSRLTLSELNALYDSAADMEMKEQVIFVLSRQDSRESVDVLLKIARSDPSREMRKQAIFWLGQSSDPRAAEYLQRLVEE
jgi:HEAT repeat protein